LARASRTAAQSCRRLGIIGEAIHDETPKALTCQPVIANCVGVLTQKSPKCPFPKAFRAFLTPIIKIGFFSHLLSQISSSRF